MIINLSAVLMLVALLLTIASAVGRAPLWAAVFVLVVDRLIAAWPR